MDTFKLVDDVLPALADNKNCGNCAYRYDELMPQQVMPSMVCHRFPPQMVAVPAPLMPSSPLQLNRQQEIRYQFMAVFPIVQAHQFCHSHTLRTVEDAPVSVTEPNAPMIDD